MHKLRIDFVSDVSCPWCAIGLKSLEDALEQLTGEVQAEIHFQPFELNPNMPEAGQDLREHLVAKYGLSPDQYRQNTEALRVRGEQVGIIFTDQRNRIYNTFDAHRLLHWADLEGRQKQLKHALCRAKRIVCAPGAWRLPGRLRYLLSMFRRAESIPGH